MRPAHRPVILLGALLLAHCGRGADAPPAPPAPASQTPPAEPPGMHDFLTLWDFRDPAGSEARFAALLPTVRAAGERALEVEVLTQIARAQGLQGRPADAHRTLDEAERGLAEGMARPRIRVLLERGRATNGRPGATDPDAPERRRRARPWFEQAFALASQAGETGLAVDAAHMLGIVEEPDAALAWNERAIEVAEASRDEAARRWLGTLYNNTGWTWFERGEYARALGLFERDVAWRLERGQAREARIARWSRAKALRHLGRVAEALEVQRALETEWEAAGAPDGFVYEELAECLRALGRPGEARPCFARAYEILAADAWFARHEAARLERLRVEAGLPAR